MSRQTPPTKATPPPAAQRSVVLQAVGRATQLPPIVAEHRATAPVLKLLIGLVWGLLLVTGTSVDTEEFRLGEIAPRTVRSPSQLIVEDAEATEQARLAAAEGVLPVVDVVPGVVDELLGRVGTAFELLRKEAADAEDLQRRVEEALGVPLDEAAFATLARERNDLSFELKLKEAIRMAYGRRLAAEPERWPAAFPSGVQLRFGTGADAKSTTMVPGAYGEVLGLDGAAAAVESLLRSRFADTPRRELEALMAIVRPMLVPNLLPNPVETERQRTAAREAVKPVLFQLKPGEVVVRSGERVNASQLKRLRALASQESTLQMTLVRAVKVALVVMAVFLLLPYGGSRPSWRAMGHAQDLVFLLIVSAIILLGIRLGTALAEPVVFAIPDLPRATVLAAMPFATLAMIYRLFFRPKVAFAVAVLFALAVSLFLEPVLLILPLTLLGGVMGIRRLTHSKRRSEFQWAGLYVGLVQTGVWFLYTLSDPSIGWEMTLKSLPFPLLGGFFAAVLAATLMPLGEWIGRYVSEVRLLELAQDDQPLLRWLHLNAPGTFNHSVSVGRLAESAAEKIGADALLARVGAYYHDIGKGFWPQYFVENQRGINPHDQIKPQLSARVIVAHVTHGADLAEKHNLPPVLRRFILEHHGTSRIEYFYRQAQEQSGDKDELVDDSAFRYPGPKPHSKETALVMLADVVESATRTLDSPSPDRIRAFIARLVNKVYEDGQLDESPLTLKDLSATEAAFSEVLVAQYHHRIDYPLGLKPGERATVVPMRT